jgi:hypothetical protein
MEHDEPLVARHARPRAGMERQVRAIARLRHDPAIRGVHAQVGPVDAAAFGVGQAEQRTVLRQARQPGRVPLVAVQHPVLPVIVDAEHGEPVGRDSPTRLKSGPEPSPSGRPSGSVGKAGCHAPPSKGWRNQRPASAPVGSSNHHRLSPERWMRPFVVPMPALVACRWVLLERSQAYSCHEPPALEK